MAFAASLVPVSSAPLAFGAPCESVLCAGSLPLVSGLLCAGRPLAILRRVGSVVVDPLQGKPFGALPHVVPESGEVLAPTIAHRDAARPVPLVGMVVRVVAAVAHLHPCLVERMPFGAGGSSVSSLLRPNFRRLLALKAAATLRASGRRAKSAGAHFRFVAAVADAQPVLAWTTVLSRLLPAKANGRKSPESLSCEVNGSLHGRMGQRFRVHVRGAA